MSKKTERQAEEMKSLVRRELRNLKVTICPVNNDNYYREILLETFLARLLNHLGVEWKATEAEIKLVKKPLPKKKTSKKKKEK